MNQRQPLSAAAPDWIWVAIGRGPAAGGWSSSAARGRGSQPAARGRAPRRGSVPVGVTAAERRDVPIWVEGLGNVTSLATVTIRARVSGQILSVAFQEGNAGQDRATCWYSSTRVRSRSRCSRPTATTQRDVATLHNDERDLVRYKDLSAQKLIAQQQYDAAGGDRGVGPGHRGPGPGGGEQRPAESPVLQRHLAHRRHRRRPPGGRGEPGHAHRRQRHRGAHPDGPHRRALHPAAGRPAPGGRGLLQGAAHRRGVGPGRPRSSSAPGS